MPQSNSTGSTRIVSPSFNVPENWIFRGMKLVTAEDPQALENTKIAMALAEMIRRDIDHRLDVSVWGPDGMTRAPANAHGRALIKIQKNSSQLDLGSSINILIFEEGSVHLLTFIADSLRDTGTFELSDPSFPATILQMLYEALTPHLGWEPSHYAFVHNG